MTDFARENVEGQDVIPPSQSTVINFGPPTAGQIDVRIRTWEARDPTFSRTSQPRKSRVNVGVSPTIRIGWSSHNDDTPEFLSLKKSDMIPNLSDEIRIFDDIPPINDLPPESFLIEILDSNNSVLTGNNGPTLLFDVTDAMLSSNLAVGLGLGTPWKLRITNMTRFRAAVSAEISFQGQRIIRTKDIDLDFINEKLDLLLNNEQPLQILIYNKQVGTRIVNPRGATITTSDTTTRRGSGISGRGQPPPPREVPIYHTVVKFLVSDELAYLYPSLKTIDFDIGAHIFTEGTRSYQITARATIHDGSLAIRLRIAFPPSTGKMSLFEIIKFFAPGFIDTIIDIVDSLGVDDTTIKINSLWADIFLVVRPRNHPFVTKGFDIIARPHVWLTPDGFSKIAEGAIMVFLKQFGEKLTEDAGEYVENLLGWLLGERGAEVTGSDETLTLHYASDEPRLGVVTPTTPTIRWPQVTPGNLSKIDHIIVLMMENRSFDHMLGFLSMPATPPGNPIGMGRTDVWGLQGNETNPINRWLDLVGVFPLSNLHTNPLLFTETSSTRGTRFPYDPGHGFEHTKKQAGREEFKTSNISQPFSVGENQGFVLNFIERLASEHPELTADQKISIQGDIMGFQPSFHVPVYKFLAEQFMIFDNWYASVPAATWPNRFVTLSGRLALGADRRPQMGNPDIATFDPLEEKTIFDYLSDASIDWRYYEHDIAMLRLFSKYTFDHEHVVSIDDPQDGFFERVRQGNLPPVTFIDPDFIDYPPRGNDDHPPADILFGQELIRRIYNALVNGPTQQWEKTLLIITYDEHGGFYDHVYPKSHTPYFDPANPRVGDFVPLAMDEDEDGNETPIDYYGMRVPTFAISPYIPQGSVSHVIDGVDDFEYDHASIAKTIIARFLPNQLPNMGYRVALARDLGPMLTLASPRQTPTIPSLPLQPITTFIPSMSKPFASDDFRGFLKGVRDKLRI